MKYKMEIGPKPQLLIDGDLYFSDDWPAKRAYRELVCFLDSIDLDEGKEGYSYGYGGTPDDPLYLSGVSIYRIRNDKFLIELKSYWDDAASDSGILHVYFDDEILIIEIHKFINKIGFVTYTRKDA